MFKITLMPSERIVRKKSDSTTSTLFTILFLLVVFLIPTVKTQTNFNYAGNGDYKDHGCTTAQLSSIYGCLKPTSNFGYRMWFMYNSASYYNFENEVNFNTTMTGFVAVTMDYQSGSSYYKRQYYHDIHPIYGGSYKLSFSAMTRKTGTLSDFAFMVIIRDEYSKNVIYFNKTYTFSDYGTINVTESITLPGINYRGWAYVHFMYTGSNTTAYNYPVGTGITNVKFQKLVCGSNQTSTLLATGETACILNKTIEGFNYCNRFNYYHKNESGYGYIYKRFVCQGCIPPYKAVGFRDDTVTQYDKYFTNHKYGCVINQIPNSVWYSLLNIKDANGKYYYTTQSCNGGSVNYLVVPGISSSNYDYSRAACGISSNASVTWWQVVNSTYYPAKCSSAGYFPVITSATTRVCQSISSQITNCAIYLANYKCYSCMSNTTLITWNNSGTLTEICVANFQPVSNCLTYTSVSGTYVCGTCDANYTLSTVSSLNVCIRNIALDGNCTSYVLNANSQYECSVCAAGYTLSSVYTLNQQIKKCLSTSTQIIRDCSVYESIAEGYQCYTCASTTNIAKYSFIYNSVTAYRCLDSFTEYLANCSTYDLVDSVYKCTNCDVGYLLSNLTINSVLSLKCLNTLTGVVSNCNGYLTDVSNNYICNSCSTGFTLKPISQVNKCLPNSVIDSQCQTYILNGSNYECSQCASEYTLSMVLTNLGTFKYCLLTSAQIRDCSVYSPAASGYQCSQCLTNPSNIHIYSISINGVSIDRCLDNQIEYDRYCQTYSFSNNVYKCTKCLNSLRFGSVTINSGVFDRCLDDYKHYVANCAAYVMSGQEDYICSQCDAGYELENAQVSDAVNNYMFTYKRCFNSTQKVANCASYITYSIVTASSPNFICKQCESGFTMKNVSQFPRCLANNLIDSQCTNYVADSNTFKCNQCASSYAVSSVYKTDGTFSNCLLISSQIRDCAVYEALQNGGYQCNQCAQSTNIGRQIFTVSGVQIYRCLNGVSEKIDFSTEYKFESQLYECIQCENNHLLKSVSVENVERKRCLDLSNQVVEDCLHYVYDSVNTKYVCDQCSNQFTLKPNNVCVHQDSLQDNCIQYLDNGLKEECTKCVNGHSLSSVSINNVDVAQCLSNDMQIIAGCKKYNLISSIYNCLECDLTYSKQTVLFSSNSVSMCLLSSSQCVQDCLTYSINSAEDFVCNLCSNGFNLKDGTGTKKLCIANANLQSNCIKYKDNGVSEECIQCDSSFTLSDVDVSGTLTKECLSNSLDIVTQCKIYQKVSGIYKCQQLATVKVGHRMTKGCLSQITEYLPFCNFHFNQHGVYYCRHAICEAGSFGIKIGPDPTQLACANNELIQFVNEANCEYFERPHYGDTEIKCEKCKDGFEEPYCSASGYQGLNGGQ